MPDHMLGGKRRSRRQSPKSAIVRDLEAIPVLDPDEALEASPEADDDDDEWDTEETRHLIVRVLGVVVLDVTLGTTTAGER